MAWLCGFLLSTLLNCGVGVGADVGATPLSGVVEFDCFCGSLGISPDPLERAFLLSALWCRIDFSSESRRARLGGRLSRWRSGTGLGSLGGSAGSAWLCPLATWFSSGGSCPRGFLGNSSSLPAAWKQTGTLGNHQDARVSDDGETHCVTRIHIG